MSNYSISASCRGIPATALRTASSIEEAQGKFETLVRSIRKDLIYNNAKLAFVELRCKRKGRIRKQKVRV